jgi:hypothetical protein
MKAEERSDAHFVGEERAKVVADCVVSLISGEKCDASSHLDLEESWRAVDMYPLII